MAARPPPRPCSTTGVVLAGWRSTPRPARPTGRTGTRGRSGSATWTARVANTLFDDGFVNVCGVAVDPANNKIYWANFSTQEIRVGNLDGTGTASTLFTDPGGSDPSGVAIDPADNKIYWTNQHSHQVRVGNLDGTGSASTLFGGDATVPTTENNPIGVAVDPAAGKVYWTNLVGGQVRVGPLGGGSVGQPSTLFFGTPSGPAVDPTANKIYWASWTSGSGIRVGNLNGTGPLDPVWRRGRLALHRGPEEACEHRAPDYLRRSQGGQGNDLPERDVSRPTCSGRSCTGPRPASELSVEEGWVAHRQRPDVHAQPGRRLHLHPDGHQPGRVDPVADELCEEGQGPLG